MSALDACKGIGIFSINLVLDSHSLTAWMRAALVGNSRIVTGGVMTCSTSKRIGLILCEEIWPWDRWNRPNVKDFHESIARALMSQWSNATCVMVLRGWNVRQLQKSLGNVKRISYHHGSKFEIHYTPLCKTRSDPPIPVKATQWAAIVIHPEMCDARLVSCTGKVFIPELVLKAMFSSKRTLQLCSYTGESAGSIMEYLKAIKKLHGVKC